MEALDPAMEKLNTVFQAAAQDMYKQGEGAEGTEGAQDASQNSDSASDEEVTDVDFEEVNEEDKKN